MRNSHPRALEPLDDVASVVEKLAVLLAAGVPPIAAWGYLADSPSNVNDTVTAVANRRGGGGDIADIILHRMESEGSKAGPIGSHSDGEHTTGRHPVDGHSSGKGALRTTAEANETAWRGLAAAWMVAIEAGAPLAPALREFASSLRALAQARRATVTALSGPVATAKLVVVLPVVGILLGIALGFDTVGTLVATPAGLVCLFAGFALLWIARWWNRRLVRAASPTELAPGLALDLLAVAVSGGASIDKAKATVTAALERCGSTYGIDDVVEADAVFDLSQRAGVPAATLLRSEAARIRREASSTAERKASTLSVTLMLPLGLCVLPAFMLLGVAPLMISVLSTTVLSPTMGGL